MSFLHPLTESRLDEWPLSSLLAIKINSVQHTLHISLCKRCRPQDGGHYQIYCTAGASQPAKLLVGLVHASVASTKRQSEFVCDLQHDCDYCYDKLHSSPSLQSFGRSSCRSISSHGSQDSRRRSLTIVTTQLQSMFGGEEQRGDSQLDQEGYMVMMPGELETDGRTPVHSRQPGVQTLPLNSTPPPMRPPCSRSKSATFTGRARVHNITHKQLQASHSCGSEPAVLDGQAGIGEPVYTVPSGGRALRDASPVPPLKEHARRTPSGNSMCSVYSSVSIPSEHYASTSIIQQQRPTASSTSNSSSESSGTSVSERSHSSATSDGKESDDEGYMTMSFDPSRAVPPPVRSNTIGWSKSGAPNSDLNDRMRRHHTVHAIRTKSSPSNLHVHQRPVLPDFNRFADAHRGYVTPDGPVNSKEFPVRLQSPSAARQGSDCYVTFTCDGKVPVSGGVANQQLHAKDATSSRVCRVSSLHSLSQREVRRLA